MRQVLFYSTFSARAEFNMACDEYLFAQVMDGNAAGLMRLYSWQGDGGITIGRNQDVQRAVDQSKLGTTPVIRRITGGRAVYHDSSELTYCIAFDSRQFRDIFPSDSVSSSSRPIAQFLRHFVAALGLPTEITSRSTDSNGSPRSHHRAPCFESQARHELVSDGHKVAASAQCRVGSCWLQHGSIKLGGLARHPALDGESLVLPDLSREMFDRAAQAMRKSALDLLGIELMRAEFDDCAMRDVSSREKSIMKNRLEVRQLIKQSGTPDSL